MGRGRQIWRKYYKAVPTYNRDVKPFKCLTGVKFTTTEQRVRPWLANVSSHEASVTAYCGKCVITLTTTVQQSY